MVSYFINGWEKSHEFQSVTYVKGCHTILNLVGELVSQDKLFTGFYRLKYLFFLNFQSCQMMYYP